MDDLVVFSALSERHGERPSLYSSKHLVGPEQIRALGGPLSQLSFDKYFVTMYRRDALSQGDTPQVPEPLYQHATSLSQWYLMLGNCL